MNILSIHSWVAYGHVGNASVMFPLQRLGAEVWAVNTVEFSNHPGYGSHTGTVATGAQIDTIIDGVAARGALARCDGVLSGYLGDPSVGEAVIRAVMRVRRESPAALYCCDPVIGDGGAIYVRAGIAELIRDQALPLADIVTPNQFELQYLSGGDCGTLAGAKTAVAALQARGPRIVLVTSLRTDATPADAVDLLVAEGSTFHLLRTPLLPGTFNGAGDAIAGLFMLHRARTGSAVTALEAAASSMFCVLTRTSEAGSRELLMVAAQDEFIAPTRRFSAQPI